MNEIKAYTLIRFIYPTHLNLLSGTVTLPLLDIIPNATTLEIFLNEISILHLRLTIKYDVNIQPPQVFSLDETAIMESR